MPYRDESMLMGGDAPSNTSTQLCFNPPGGPFDQDNQVIGNISHVGDEDWIVIELTEGYEYTIAVGGSQVDGQLNDSILKLMDGKGGPVDMNDDVDGAKGMLGSEIKFTPEAGSGTQKYFISVSGYTGNPGAMNTGDYTVDVKAVAIMPADEGEPIMAESDVDHKLIGTSAGESITGMDGNDTLQGRGGDDTLSGGGGDDLLQGGPGADDLNGGDGDDTIAYSDSEMGVTVNLSDGSARRGDAEGDTIGTDIENVIGSMYDDMLTGTRVNNKLWGRAGNDELDGGRGDDKLYGEAGDDSLDGGDGDDTLTGGYGADMLAGGDGVDTVSYMGSMMGVTVRLHSGQAMGGDAEGDMFIDNDSVPYTNEDGDTVEKMVPDPENLTGSDNADILAGDLRNNIIKGGGGDDKIYGGPNPEDARMMNNGLTNGDMLYGGAGNDMIFGGVGIDMLHGDDGNDMLHGGPGADKLYGGAGSDMIYADADDDMINGWLDPMDDPTTDKDESMETETEVDPMAVDTVSYERLEEGVMRSLAESADGVTITNVENIIGSQDDDTLTGNGGNNVIEGGEGSDTLSGGSGTDTLSYRSSDDWVRVTLSDEGMATTTRGHASGDKATEFEDVIGSAHDDDITGNREDNTLWGLAGDDELVGGKGNDTVIGGAGADDMNGGDDGASEDDEADTLSYQGSGAGVTANLATFSFSGGHAEGDTIATIEVDHDMDEEDAEDPTDRIEVSTFENLTGSDHDDTLTGDYRDNVIDGGAGDDTIRGGEGADRLTGGAGADMLDGGTSEMEGINHIDWAVYREATIDKDTNAGVTVNLETRMGEAGDAMGDTLVNIELVWGSKGDDVFIASAGHDMVHGDIGIDTLSYELSDMGVVVDLGDAQNVMAFDGSMEPDENYLGEAIAYMDEGGKDVDNPTEIEKEDNTNGAAGDSIGGFENLTGSAHNDMLTGDDMKNVLKGGAGNDELNGVGGDDTLDGGAGDDKLNGGDGADTINGGDGADIINGGDGADIINGGAGDDDLSGGEGGDKFVFSPDDGAGSDIILDFTVGEDKIDLSAYGLTDEQLDEAIIQRGTSDDGQIVINLEAYGGGRITIEDISDRADVITDGIPDTEVFIIA